MRLTLPRQSLIAALAALFVLVSGTGRAAAQGIDTSTLCSTCKPCEDFYKYVNTLYLQAHPIPGEYSEWGPWTALEEHNLDVLHTILTNAAERARKGIVTKGSNEQKIGDFFASALDSVAIERRGLQPLQTEFASIDAIGDAPSLLREIARTEQLQMRVPFSLGVDQDPKNSERIMMSAWQGGLGLPDRDYYFRKDAHAEEIRTRYLKYIAKMMSLAGEAPAAADRDAKTVMAMETRLAAASMTRVESRNPDSVYHDMRLPELQSLTPHLQWPVLISLVGAQTVGDVNIGQPGFFRTLDTMIASEPVANWRTYFKWHFLESFAGLLPHTFVDESFDFNKLLYGANEQQPRWKRGIWSTDRNLGEALGQEYVKVAFPPEAKARMQAMIQNLKDALHNDLEHLGWISDTTRSRAIEKLNAFAQKIGYPDKWRDYSNVNVEPGKYFENVLSARTADYKHDLNKLGKPLDRTEWGMTPPTINAYYDAGMNEIVFPAGILQPPFFDFNADDAINYGAIGTIIGHEMTHGFDDNGAKFDAKGNLTNWWTAEDLKNFEERAKCIIDQFSSYAIEDSIHLVGGQVVGESIADLGGVTLAYSALEHSLQGKPRTTINGFTPEQRFFLGYARQWAANMRPEYQRTLVATDTHPLNYFRVIGPLSNFPPFAKAFNCHEGDKMVRPASERCEIW